jgi:hypothetical protein
MEIDHAGIKVEHFRIDPFDSQFGKTKTIEEWRNQSAQSGMFLFANIESPGSGFDLRVVFTKANISDGFFLMNDQPMVKIGTLPTASQSIAPVRVRHGPLQFSYTWRPVEMCANSKSFPHPKFRFP